MAHAPTKAAEELYMWLHCPTPREDATARLFCFPHAGGSDSAFAEFAECLNEDIEVHVINLPGRGRRSAEPTIDDWDVLKSSIIEVLRPLLNKPFFFFGHSAGVLLELGTLREMQHHGLPLPRTVFASGHGAPHAVPDLPDNWHAPQNLVQLVRDWGGTDEALLADPQSRAVVLEPIRADLLVAERVHASLRQHIAAGGGLGAPLVVLAGAADETLPPAALAAWADLPDATETHALPEGGHFYLDSASPRNLAASLVLGRVARDVEQAVDEAYAQLERWNAGTMPYPADKCLHELFEEQARRTPHLPAVVADGLTLTFRELDAASAALARRLQKAHGVGRGRIVGILMERSLEYVVAYLAILRAGGAYMPLELVYPPELLDRVLRDTKAAAVVSKPRHLAQLPADFRDTVCFEFDADWLARTEAAGFRGRDLEPPGTRPDDLAFVVMSSGTTGAPKGILNPHRGAVHSYHWRYVHYPYAEGEREAAGVFFVWEVVRPLMRGKPVYVVPDATVFDPAALVQYIHAHRITRVLFTPSLAELVLDQGGAELARLLESLRIVWLCGEVVTLELRNRLVALLPDCKMLNLYSISECHDVSVSDLNRLDPGQFPEYAPCGRPMENVRVFVLNEQQAPQPIGVPGEVYVAGPCLALGYLNMPEKTQERFVPVPGRLAKREGELMYRTGDRGRLLPGGDLELIGRCDFMVKIRGYSVVLGAVETAIIAHESIASAVVVTDGQEGQDKRLVAYVVPESWSAATLPSAANLRKFLKGKLPMYAIPSIFVVLDALPLHKASHKLDRKSLPDLATATRLRATSIMNESDLQEQEIAKTPIQEEISKVWHSLLRLDPEHQIGLKESFFDIGGHSLLATRAVAAVEEAVGVKVPLGKFLQGPTIAEMAQAVEAIKSSNEGSTHASTENNNNEGALDNSSVNFALEAEALDHSIYPASTRKTGYSRFRPQLVSWVPRRVFLTGSTGFLGAFILAELIKSTNTVVFCLVRDKGENSPATSSNRLSNRAASATEDSPEVHPGLDRIVTALRKYSLLEEEVLAHLDERVVPIIGDMSRPLLGLKNDDFKGLASEIDCIIHNGAEVNLVKPYSELKVTNVLATQEVLRLAVTNGLWQTRVKPVHFISTNSVFSFPNPPTPAAPWVCEEDGDISECWRTLTEGYSQSKWVAERMVHVAQERGLPVCVFRPGNMGPSATSGAWNASDFVYLTVVGCAVLGCAPKDVDWKFDVTPVDFAAKAIVHLSCQAPTKALGHTFHVQTPDKPVEAAVVFDSLAKTRPGFRMVSLAEWRQKLEEASLLPTANELIQKLAVGIDSFIPYFGTKAPVFKCDKLTQALRTSGMCCPPVDGASMLKAVEFTGI